MTINTNILTSILAPQYKLESGSSVVSGLLGAKSQNPSFDLLSASLNSASTNSDLKETIQNFTPHNTKLIANLDAISVLAETVNNEVTMFDSYISPYDQAKYSAYSSLSTSPELSLLA